MAMATCGQFSFNEFISCLSNKSLGHFISRFPHLFLQLIPSPFLFAHSSLFQCLHSAFLQPTALNYNHCTFTFCVCEEVGGRGAGWLARNRRARKWAKNLGMDGWKLGDCVRIGRNKIKESRHRHRQPKPPLTTTAGPKDTIWGI